MKINAVLAARAVWLVPTVFLNPKGRYIYGDLATIKDKYAFIKTPLDGKLPPDQKDGYRFENGLFQSKNGPIEIIHCTLHTDGIVLETRASTEDSEDFLVDFSTWGAKEIGLAKPDGLPIKKIYASELNFSLSKAPEFFNPALAEFFAEVNGFTGNETQGPSAFIQFDFATDMTRNKVTQKFTFAREVDTAAGENRYYSFASTSTKKHIAALEKLEKLIT